MNEAIITFVSHEFNAGVLVPFTKVVRVEFEGTPEQFLQMLNSNKGSSGGWPIGFEAVATEDLTAQA
jgi:hypothetical protein